MKNKKLVLILSSIVILLPILFGLIFWNSLPESLNTHWGFDGKPDGIMSKTGAIFILPLFLLVFHWLCIWLTEKAVLSDGQNPKLRTIVLWIIPAVSLVANGAVYAGAYELDFSISKLLLVFFGVMFIVIGNYIPKCKQNFTMGIKIKWTLANEENWNATHRLAGKIWVIGGIIMMLCMLLPEKFAFGSMLAIIVVMVTIPTVYSYKYYKKQVKEGRADKKPVVKVNEVHKKMGKKVLSVVVIILVIVAVSMFFTGYEVEFGDTAFKIEAFGYDDLTVEYSVIDSVELTDKVDYGFRSYGYGGIDLLMGRFRNDTFGNYTLYAYRSSNKCVVIKSEGKILVYTGEDTKSTEEFYNKLVEKTAEYTGA